MIFDKMSEIQKNILLAPHTTFKIGGRVDYFFEAKNEKDLIKILKLVKENKISFFILVCGSNVLIPDKGFRGLAIKIQNSKFKIQNCNGKFKIICDAGVLLSKLIQETVKIRASGLEWFVGIPGTIGGAVYGNAGLSKNKKNIGDIVKQITVLRDESQIKISHRQCRFHYRDSIFKHNNDIILSVELELQNGDILKMEKTIKEILLKRKNDPKGSSVGCIFKNIDYKTLDEKIFQKHPELKNIIKNNSISAGYLIEQCGLKGKKIGGAIVSEKHANFIININQAKAEDVIMLISLIKQKVRNEFNIQLQEEIQYIGF